jgi:3-phenylpropionate/cinnamic acid dioxygenase small subunit
MDPVAVEAIRQLLATYTQALDDGRTDDVVATFCKDGSCDLPGLGHFEGHDAMREAYSRVEPRRPQRHLVLNTRIVELTEHEATAVSDVVFLLHREAAWSVQLVGRYTDTLHGGSKGWRFHHRAAEFVP